MSYFNAREASHPAWVILTESEYDTVWDRFYAEFNFRPSVRPQDWPGIKEPAPSTTYRISAIYGAAHYSTMLDDLNAKTLGALQKCVEQGQRLYALDWQHICYWFYPHEPFDVHNEQAWKVPVLPNGDYYTFLAEDFNYGLFGHPWEQTICLFGQALLSAYEHDLPLLFTKPVRRDGMEV